MSAKYHLYPITVRIKLFFCFLLGEKNVGDNTIKNITCPLSIKVSQTADSAPKFPLASKKNLDFFNLAAPDLSLIADVGLIFLLARGGGR